MKTECEEDDIVLPTMSENTGVLHIPNSVMENLRCFLCDGYLSCGPIRLFSDGSCICGRCSPDNNVMVVSGKALESVLNNATFPCRFNHNGCTERILFGQATDHESACAYSCICPFSCIKQKQGQLCSWKGTMLRLGSHLTTNHQNVLKDEASFKIQVDQNEQEVFMVFKDNIIFVIKYFYDSSSAILKYDIRFCKNTNLRSASFKFKLINISDAGCNMNLKLTCCFPYDFNFHDNKNVQTLNIAKLLESLGNPNCVEVSIGLFVESFKVINYELLETLKCGQCDRYLVPPLYTYSNKACCFECAKWGGSYYKSLNDDKLLQLVTETEIPCRWRACDFIGKTEFLRKHEFECQFKIHSCFLSCKIFFMQDAIDHYKKEHNAQYMSQKVCFKINDLDSKDHHYVVTNINNFLTLCECYSSFDSFYFKLYSTSTDNITAVVNIEHQHCRLTPKPFKICSTSNNTRMQNHESRSTQLPSCFKSAGKITITIRDWTFDPKPEPKPSKGLAYAVKLQVRNR